MFNVSLFLLQSVRRESGTQSGTRTGSLSSQTTCPCTSEVSMSDFDMQLIFNVNPYNLKNDLINKIIRKVQSKF